MTRFILTDDQPIVLTDHNTDDVETTTKYAACEVIERWYGPLADQDGTGTVRDEIDTVVAAIENRSDLSGSTYLGLSITLAD